ncbi:ABC transporter ATP-binding protein [Labrys okinawensis]|uniref:ABC transporter ATP-binding protein n=1 Tax=Labrys okinawensis TaxID=346911 RepID=UPI0039BC51CF
MTASIPPGEVSQGEREADAVTPIISLQRLSKAYGPNLTVLDDVSLDVRPGEFLTLLGPSGSGKTTTLMLMAGFQYPTSGRVIIAGRDVTALAAYKRNLGVVFQSYALFPHMTVAQNVAFPLAVRKISRTEIEKRVREALELVHLGDLGGRRPAQLSGGQQQRVALARALVYRPEIILMDEPLGALDRALRDAMQREFRDIHRRLGMTFVYVTHDQAEALTMSDRVAVFHSGRVVQIGSPLEVYQRPKSRFVASFLGEANLLEGHVAQVNGGQAQIRLATKDVICVPSGEATAVGQGVTVIVRPEAVEVGATGQNALQGMLESTDFHGDHIRLSLALAGGVKIAARVGVPAFELPQPGSMLKIGIPNHDRTIVLLQPSEKV